MVMTKPLSEQEQVLENKIYEIVELHRHDVDTDFTITVLECTCGSRTVEIYQEGVEDILVLNGEDLDLIVNLYMNGIDG